MLNGLATTSVAESINHPSNACAPNNAVEHRPTGDRVPIGGQRNKISKPCHRVTQDASANEKNLLERRVAVRWPEPIEHGKAGYLQDAHTDPEQQKMTCREECNSCGFRFHDRLVTSPSAMCQRVPIPPVGQSFPAADFTQGRSPLYGNRIPSVAAEQRQTIAHDVSRGLASES